MIKTQISRDREAVSREAHNLQSLVQFQLPQQYITLPLDFASSASIIFLVV